MTLSATEDKQHADVIYTDFAKAFGKCGNDVIAHKLWSKGITGKVERWIFNFLTSMTQRAIVNTVKSRSSTDKSSVPSKVPYLLRYFFSSSYQTDKDTNYSTVSSFADDTRIFMRVDNIEDTANLQSDVNQVFHWVSDYMMFNENKFQLLRYGQNENIKTETINKVKSNHTIERKSNVNYLGVIMSEDLTYTSYHKAVVTTARKMTGWITRTFQTRAAIPMMILFKCSLGWNSVAL
ncbi:uncharacterized protein [Procambarus clarkii]|uniref:uncharacterized protein n=1 Tax=Procambarus clarkii TaxID=6728 RepID=UPI003743AE4E